MGLEPALWGLVPRHTTKDIYENKHIINSPNNLIFAVLKMELIIMLYVGCYVLPIGWVSLMRTA